MDHHGTHFVCLAGVELLVVARLGYVVLPQGHRQVAHVLVLDAVSCCHHVLVIDQNSTTLTNIVVATEYGRSDLLVTLSIVMY